MASAQCTHLSAPLIVALVSHNQFSLYSALYHSHDYSRLDISMLHVACISYITILTISVMDWLTHFRKTHGLYFATDHALPLTAIDGLMDFKILLRMSLTQIRWRRTRSICIIYKMSPNRIAVADIFAFGRSNICHSFYDHFVLYTSPQGPSKPVATLPLPPTLCKPQPPNYSSAFSLLTAGASPLR